MADGLSRKEITELRVDHDYAPGEGPTAAETWGAWFGEILMTPSFLLLAASSVVVFFSVLYLANTSKRRRKAVGPPLPPESADDVTTAEIAALRRARQARVEDVRRLETDPLDR